MANTTKRFLGMQSIKLGAIASDGGMGRSLTAFGDTVRDSTALTETDPTKQDFFNEEQDDAIESVTTAKGAATLAFSTYNTDPAVLVELFGGVASDGSGKVLTHGSITGGSGGTNGTYTDVEMTTDGEGKEVRATITVAAGAVTAVVFTEGGYGNEVGDLLSVASATIPGLTGFSTAVATVGTGTPFWDAPSVTPDIEMSVEISDQRGNKISIPRGKVNAKKTLNFKRTALGIVDVTITALVPNKSGVAPYRIYKVAV